MKKIFIYILVSFLFLDVYSQRKRSNSNPDNTKKEDKISLSAMKLRNVGPAFLSGRIADIAIHPKNENVWYVATGSSGVWKTENSGTTWKPIFDREASYSTGCVTIDPNDNSIIWIGTGENVGGRHVAYGDGIYKSTNGGKSWTNMGLKKSEHISKIIVHPNNSDIVWVASQGPLWSSGGERGLYKTIDGGKNWKKVLGGNEWTGVTELVIDPRNPNNLYAATWQRHRTVAALMGGGPDSGLHRSIDGGETWEKLKTGLPKSNIGKIGLAISPQKPDVLYAALELERTKGAVYKSEDRGSSWTKMSNTVSGGTGPHYYQELYTSPHKFDRLYLMNVRILTSEDGGKTFNQLKEREKHSDNHSIAFRKNDPNYLLIGTDAGIYESFDLAENWKYLKNLPITQFYKVAVNNAFPFYHIFGGTQDNGSAGGPSRTDERQGIRNANWYKILGADGHQTATDPVYDDIVYGEFQQGVLHRVDLKTGEAVLIQPQPREGESYERYNWDSPILVSPHKPERLYFASYRVWKSENRGDSWEPISEDLTRNEERIDLSIMGKRQGWDNAWDVGAMSNYNTITSISESPVQEGIIYAGTDDGFIQVTSNGGSTWKKIPVTALGLPERTFVNDIKADLYDANTVYVSLDNHKEGDYSSYLFKSSDLGVTWTSISNNIPENTIIWRLVQDHISKDLLFTATEYGIYVSMNGGEKWQKLPGSPTISFRDITIQKRENDLVGASFGRGFYVLDDYSALREMSKERLAQEGALFSTRDALWYIPRSIIGNTGADYYFADNPEFGATFTYHLSKSYSTMKKERIKNEKELDKKGQSIPKIDWKAINDESRDEGTKIWVSIKNLDGEVINKVNASNRKGLNRVTWNLRYPNERPINPDAMRGRSGRGGGWYNMGALAAPGQYTATLYKEAKGIISMLDGPINFNVVDLQRGTLKGVSYEEYRNHTENIISTQNRLSDISNKLSESINSVKAMRLALSRSKVEISELSKQLYDIDNELNNLNILMYGNSAKSEIGERNNPSINNYIGNAMRGLSSTYGPTGQHKQSLNIAESMLNKMSVEIEKVISKIEPLKIELSKIDAPYIIGN
tara:strand:- start:22177 stop:25440 length:3264 start_codon:yes stop_codon:yes gene_type:complete